MRAKKFLVIFTNGNATSVIATSRAVAKKITQGSLDGLGNPRKVRSIREVAMSSLAEAATRQTFVNVERNRMKPAQQARSSVALSINSGNITAPRNRV